MPRVRPLVAVLVLCTSLVLGAEAATAQAEEQYADLACEIDVAGRVPSEPPPSSTTGRSDLEAHHFVMWRVDMGWSLQAACHYRLDQGDAARNIERIVVGLNTQGGSGWHARAYRYFDGPPLGPAWQASTSSGWGAFNTTCAAVDLNIAKGFGAYCNADQASDQRHFVKPLITAHERSGRYGKFQLRFDFEPKEGGAGNVNAGNCGNAPAWQCPATTSTMYIPRSAILVGFITGGVGNRSVSNPSFEGLNETGASRPISPPTPSWTPPPMDEPRGACKITGWTLKNVTDGRTWTNDSPDRYDIIMTSGHEHTLTVRFTGRPSTVRVQVRRDAETVSSAQVMSPQASPVSFTLVGSGLRSQLSVSCIGSDGDIPPDGQDVVTDEDENPKTSLAECLGDGEFELTSPGTWVRGLIHGVGCLFSWAFIPTKPMSERFYEVRSSSDAATAAGGAVAGLSAGFTTLSTSEPGDCTGPTINVPAAGMTDQQPFNSCDNWLGDAAALVRRILLGLIAISTVAKMWRILQGAINGDSVTIYQAEFNSETSSGGTWA